MRKKKREPAKEREVSLEEIQALAARVREKARERYGLAALWDRYKTPVLLAGGALVVVGGLRARRGSWAARVPWGSVAAGAGAAAAVGAMLWAANRAGQAQQAVVEAEAPAPPEEGQNPAGAGEANRSGSGPELERITMRRR